MSKKELIYLLALQRIPNIGDISAKKLLQHLGSAEAVFKEKKSNLMKINGIGSHTLKELHKTLYLEEAEAELKFIETNGIETVYFQDKKYPENLKHCIDAPILLFQKGNLDLRRKKIISIVGTRKATVHGVAFCEKLIEDLAPLNPVIVSGFAYGIDIAAHKAAFKNNLQTVACMAHGLDKIYPKTHAKYREQVEANGGFVTDFWSNSDFLPANFLSRNRIVAGLGQATIVVESAEKGGSLVTADIANSYNREVFAVPGRPTDLQSKGCNNLLKQQKAQALTCAADLIYMLNWDLEKPQPEQQKLFVELPPDEEKVFSVLQKTGKCELDELALESGLPTFQLASLLLNLELKGLVRPLPGKQFEVV
ncbi:MAG TPA: DNA-processing protein DprA [Flavobacteriaceae bacterium]|nr:DNA-processing protein DprA [Flavobacteriaceae bacterium]